MNYQKTCDIIAGLDVSNGAQNVTILNVNEIKRGYESGDCPVAFIQAFDDAPQGEFTTMALDSNGFIHWNIPVLFLEAPVEEDLGPGRHARALVAFMENFIQALVNAKSSFCTNGLMVVGIVPRRAVITYAGRRFYGASFIVRVRDSTRIT